jgi:hypothetical protein
MYVLRSVRARLLTRRLQATGALDGRLLATRYDLGITRIHYHSGFGCKHSMIEPAPLAEPPHSCAGRVGRLWSLT